MASAKQIAWRKKFARMSKAGKFKKAKKSNPKKSKVKKKSFSRWGEPDWNCKRDDAEFEKRHDMPKGQVRKNIIMGIHEQMEMLTPNGLRRFTTEFLKNRKVEELSCEELHDGWQKVPFFEKTKTDKYDPL